MKLRNALFGIGASMALGISTAANAFIITAGDLKITFDAVASGTTGYNGVGEVCNTVATCDTAAGSGTAPGASGSEDSWGIFSVAVITNETTNETIFTKGADGYLLGMFFGLTDYYVEGSGNVNFNLDVWVEGGGLKIWESGTDWAGIANTSPTGVPSPRTALDEYTGISGGDLWLEAAFAPGAFEHADTFFNQATYFTSFSPTALTGQGSGFMNVVGGSQQERFDTNNYTTFTGDAADLFFQVVFTPAGNSDWTVIPTGAAFANASSVPEPGTLALMGLALAGLGFSRRLRRA